MKGKQKVKKEKKKYHETFQQLYGQHFYRTYAHSPDKSYKKYLIHEHKMYELLNIEGGRENRISFFFTFLPFVA